MATLSDSSPPRRNWTIWLVLAALIVGGTAWWVIEEGPHEIARWREAAAWEAFFAGDVERAIEILDEAIAWHPDRADLYLIRGQWRSELGQLDEALADINRSIELDDGEVKSYRTASGIGWNYAVRSEIYQQLDMPEKAVADWGTIAATEGIGGHPTIVNGEAYARAVGNIELERGLQEAQTAIDILGGDMKAAARCGMFLYRTGEGDAAARQFGRTMDVRQRRYKEVKEQLTAAKAAEPFLGDLLESGRFVRRADNAAASYARALAYRGYCFAKAGKDQLAQADLKEAEELGADLEAAKARLDGVDLDEKAKEEEQKKLFDEASAFSAFLDTRGFLHYRLGDNEAALKDLNLAVEVAEALHDHQVINSVLPPNEYAYYQKQKKKVIAVMRYHRALVQEALGNQQAAQRDLKRVRDLGFEPSPTLH
jgi:tetratricopeptide (TPR) repeat protein